MLESYLKALELGYFEVQFAFEGLPDEKVWTRPADGLLSIGELAGHVAYWEAVRFAGEAGEVTEHGPMKTHIQSPLVDDRFAYYPTTIAHPPSSEHRAMGTAEVYRELVRVHEESIAYFHALNPDLESAAPGYPAHYTYGEFLKYAAFHIAYHTGQMYSARYLLGDAPPDN
jgi:hypothetical protein